MTVARAHKALFHWTLVAGTFAVPVAFAWATVGCSSLTTPHEELAISTSSVGASPSARPTAPPRATTNLAEKPVAPPDPTNRPPPPAVPTDVKAAPKDAKKTASGLAYKTLTPGKSKVHPTAQSTVNVHYSGWTTDGKMFDSSVARGQPAEFELNRVIKGWTEGLQLMVEGEKTRFWIPGALAYGDTPSRPGAPVGMLVFDVELLEIKK